MHGGELLRLNPSPGTSVLGSHRGQSSAIFDLKGKKIAENGVFLPSEIPRLRQEAEKGKLFSQLDLAKALEHSSRDATNRIEAYKWASVASAGASSEARDLVRYLDLFTASAEKSQGAAAAEAFLAAKPKAL